MNVKSFEARPPSSFNSIKLFLFSELEVFSSDVRYLEVLSQGPMKSFVKNLEGQGDDVDGGATERLVGMIKLFDAR